MPAVKNIIGTTIISDTPISKCSNGAINPPLCTTSSTVNTTNITKCENGATNPPTCTLSRYSTSVTLPSIAVISPNTGEVYKAGDKINVKWKSNNVIAKVVGIMLVDAKSVERSQLEIYPTDNDGFETITIPSNISSGINYRIFISNDQTGGAYSNYFTINSTDIKTPSITVLSPNGGEVYNKGDKIKISVSNGLYKTRIGLVYPDFNPNNEISDGNEVHWLSLFNNADKSFVWDGLSFIDNDGNKNYFTAGVGNYKIVAVIDAEVSKCYLSKISNCDFDISDNTFTIADKDIPNTTIEDVYKNTSLFIGKSLMMEGYIYSSDIASELVKSNNDYINLRSSNNIDSQMISMKINSSDIRDALKKSYSSNIDWIKVFPSGTIKSVSLPGNDFTSQVIYFEVDSLKIEGNMRSCPQGSSGTYPDCITGEISTTTTTGYCPLNMINPLSLCSDGKIESASKDINGCVTSYKCTNPDTSLKVINPTTDAVTRTLKVGVIGDDVKVLQSFLGLTPDGKFGKNTKAKVVEWQRENNLTPDGSFGNMSRVKAGLNK